MTEIRPVLHGKGLGLFATQSYSPGQVILEETPIFVFTPQQQHQRQQDEPSSSSSYDDSFIQDMFLHSKKKTSVSIQKFLKHLIPFSTITTIPDDQEGKFYGMMLALVSYAAKATQNNESTTTQFPDDHGALWKLYCPMAEPLTDVQNNILFMAKEVLRVIQPHVNPHSTLFSFITNQYSKCIHIMLLWSYNSFQDGLVYEITSRVNHSCDPNAYVRTTADQQQDQDQHSHHSQRSKQQQQLVATCLIQPGEEICMSYLGLLTYAGYATRQEQLLFSKHFHCSCSHCSWHDNTNDSSTTTTTTTTSNMAYFNSSSLNRFVKDPASAIPCPICHPRQGTIQGRRSLLLDESLHYHDFHEPTSNGNDQTIIVQYAVPLFSIPISDTTTSKVVSNPTFLECTKCGIVPITTELDMILTLNQKVIQRITAHITLSAPRLNLQLKDSHELLQSKMELGEELFHLSSSVLGARHWCTMLLSLQVLEYSLASLHTAMLFSGQDENGLGEPPDLVQLAECIDSLQKLFSYLELLQLKSHPGHVLSGVTIGVARMLVSLGDGKSKKYAAEWIEKIDSYIQQGFEGESMKRVVETLKCAWLKSTTTVCEPQMERNLKTNDDDDDNLDGGKIGSSKKIKKGHKF